MRLERTMKRTFLSSLVLGPALALAALLVPGIAAAAGPITSSACTDADGGAHTSGTAVTCNLWAKVQTGGPALPGTTVTTWWGFADSASGSPSLPGPVLLADAGDIVTVTLVNNLAQPTSILFGGQAMAPDQTGVAGGGTTSYTFTASGPGTYLYEAGLIPGSQYQVSMGLYGALVVRPAGAPAQAYANPATLFDDEALVIVSEIDPALNASATPWTVDLRAYAPKYFLVNGAAHTTTPAICATPSICLTSGHKLLLRYANAGIQHHSLGVLGLHQAVLAADGSELPYPRTMVAETVAPGQSADVMVTVPATSAASTRYALYDAALVLNNSSSNGIGGMLAFIEASAGAPPPVDTVGPITSAVTMTESSPGLYTLTATVDDTSTGGSFIQQAEYRIDSTLATPTAMTAVDLAFNDEVSEGVTSVSGAIDTTSWTSPHTIYVRGQDNAGTGNWGAFAAFIFTPATTDTTGPITSGLVLTPSRTNGSVGVGISATGSDSTTGNSNVVEAEYTIDGGTAAPMTLNKTAPTVSLTATIAQATVNALSSGPHTISVRSRDFPGNWGSPATATLTIDKAGPATTGVTASPNPNNGQLGQSSTNLSVRVSATLDDTSSGGSNIVAGEGFIETVGADGTGFPFVATDGTFDEVNDPAYAEIPLTTINLLTTGDHTIYVHGKDAAGNWGTTASTILVIERTPPAILSINRADPTPTSAASVSWTVTFSESVVGVTSANFSLVSGSGLTGAAISSVTGTGATRTVTATTGSGGGTLGLNLTSATGIRDIAGNALPTTGLPFVGQVYGVAPLYFSTLGNTNPPSVAGTADDADIYFWSGSAFSRSIDVTAITNAVPAGANVDGFDRVSATQYYMSFGGAVTLPVLGTVQDEDVVFYNAGTWSLFFDGSVNGVGGTDLDAISVVGGTLYFSTDSNTLPPGAGGTADDADIYRWNGASSYTRVVDASTIGIPSTGGGNANVDGVVWVDPTHFYLSFAGDATIALPGPDLTVQDEDVVYRNGSTWSVYFDGTSKGLTSANLDVDAFDLP